MYNSGIHMAMKQSQHKHGEKLLCGRGLRKIISAIREFVAQSYIGSEVCARNPRMVRIRTLHLTYVHIIPHVVSM